MHGNGPTSPSFLAGGGEMGELIRSMDWSQTPLGPPETWPQSLRTTLNVSLASNFPICFIWGPERVQFYNDGYWPICGAKHPHSMGQDFRECWFSAWPVVGPGFEACVERGETSFFTDTGMFLDRNGYLEETFFTFSFSPIRDEGGNVAGVFHPVTETTHLVLAERRLQLLRALAGATANAHSINEALATTAEELSKHSVDLPFAVLYRVDGDAEVAVLAGAAGLRPGAPGAPAHVDISQESSGWPIARVATSGEMASVNNVEALFGPLSCGPYPEPPQRALLFPITTAAGNRPTAVLVAAVSTRRALDEPYLRFFEMLAAGITSAVSKASAYEEEKQRSEMLAELDRVKTVFFSNVSHEFRTPLTLMLGPLEDLLNNPSSRLEPAVRAKLEVAHGNGLRLLKLVNTLLDFSRIEAGRAQPHFRPVDLASFTVNLASSFRSTIEAAGLRFVVDCPSGAERVHVDPEMWEKIVLNLLSNAFKFTLEGEIAVQLSWSAERVSLMVRDSGTGIPQEELPRIFERFHQVKGVVGRSYEGSGIGLSLVQELVQIHSGAIHAFSEPGVGSVFTVELPLGVRGTSPDQAPRAGVDVTTPQHPSGFVAEVARWLTEENGARGNVPASRASETAGDTGAQAANGRSRSRVIVADDNADMRGYLVSLLQARYEVVAVPDGASALSAAQEEPPELILSDVMMPNLDGFGLLSAIRNDPRTRAAPFILLSARAGAEARVDGLEAGADDYLVKPFSAAELLARVEANLRLSRLRQEIERAAGREEALRDANRRKDEFLAMLSHELRNPLSPLLTSAAVLQRDGLESAMVKRQCGIIQRQTALLRRLLDDLLDGARISRGKISLQRERLDLVEAVCQAVDACRSAAVERDQELALEAPDQAIWVDADPVRLEQILCNLILNASKFTSRNGSVRVTLTRGDTARISVRDNGEGMSADLAPRIFDLFTQGERDVARSQGGLGIGLTMVRSLTELHGGTVEAYSQGVGLGSEFTITLPLAGDPHDV